MAVLTDDIRHDSPNGRWRLLRAAPAPALTGLVAGYEGYAEASPAAVIRRETPSPHFPVILTFAGGFRIAEPGGGWRDLPPAFTAGLYEHSVLVGSAGVADCLQIDLTPLGARRLFRLDLGEIRNRTLDLGEILGPEASRLCDALATTPGWAARIALAERFLLRRIAARPAHRRAAAAWARLAGSHGALPIGRLAASLDLSRQALATLFAREIGLAPKAAARVLRFDHALGLMRQAPATSLAILALDAGYADQAHFTREAQVLAGETPAVIRARLLPDGTGLMAEA